MNLFQHQSTPTSPTRSPPPVDTMAPQKKSKKDAGSINSKLALVMKSGKGT